MTWEGFPHNWPFMRGIHQWLVVSPHKGPVMQNSDGVCLVSMIKHLVKQSNGQWNEMTSHVYDVPVMSYKGTYSQPSHYQSQSRSLVGKMENLKNFATCNFVCKYNADMPSYLHEYISIGHVTPGGHCWGRYTGTLSFLSSPYNSFKDWAPVPDLQTSCRNLR